jgi:integrase
MYKPDFIQTWLDSVAISHSGAKTTETLYRYEFETFLKFIDATPEAILKDYEELPEKRFKQKYAQFLRAWISHLMRSEYSPGSVASFMIAVKSFFKHNDLPLSFVAPIRKRVSFHNRDISKEEILQVLGISAPREKAFFNIMAQSGLRPTTLCMLKLKNLEPDFSQGKIPLMIKVPEEDTKGKFHAYFTFIGEESVRLLKDYLNTRRNLTPENYLFVNQGSEQPMIYNTVSSMFRKAVRLLKDKGVMNYEQKKADRPAEVRLYNLRKWFRKMAIQAGFENVEFWMGHTGPGVDEAYRPKDPEFYRQIYAEKAMPFLRLETSTPTETEKTIEKQAGEIKELRETLALIQKKFGDMEKHLSEVKKATET